MFLITPASCTAGRYTLTELRFAEQKWRHPTGRVLPVLVRATPLDNVPAYLRAVNFLVPHGDAAAETAQEVKQLVRALSGWTRVVRRLRSPTGIAVLAGGALLLGAAVWIVAPLVRGRATRGSTATALPDPVRHRARGVAAMADGGFVVAAATPSQLVRFAPTGAQVGEPIAMPGEPVSVARTPTQIMIVTRAPDGVTVLDWNDLRVIDTVTLDPARVKPPFGGTTTLPRLSGDIQAIAVAGPRIPFLWAVTGERDGEPAVLRFRAPPREWEVPSWSAKPEGIVGGDARGLKLRLIGSDLWAVTSAATPSSLYHMVGTIRIDEFRGHDLRMVSCARDLAASPNGNLLFLSCENELQEVTEEARTLKLVRARPTLPAERDPNSWTDEILVPDGTAVVVALNTEVGLPRNRPGRARIAEVDEAGAVRTVLDERDAVVHSLAVTPQWVLSVLRRADGRFDAVRTARSRP